MEMNYWRGKGVGFYLIPYPKIKGLIYQFTHRRGCVGVDMP